MKVPAEKLVGLLKALGVKTADKLAPDMLRKKLNKIESLAEDEAVESLDRGDRILLNKIMKSQDSGEPVEIEFPEAKREKPNGHGKKSSAKTRVEEDEDDRDEDEDEPARKDPEPPKRKPGRPRKEPEPEKVPAGKKKKRGRKKKPAGEPRQHREGGVIDTIVKLLHKTSVRKPITKGTILKILTEKFPDRRPESMMNTINIQVPSRLRVERELDVRRTPNGYYLHSE